MENPYQPPQAESVSEPQSPRDSWFGGWCLLYLLIAPAMIVFLGTVTGLNGYVSAAFVGLTAAGCIHALRSTKGGGRRSLIILGCAAAQIITYALTHIAEGLLRGLAGSVQAK